MPTPTTPPSPEMETDQPDPDKPEEAAAAPVFWRSLPGILTGLATVLTAATSLFVALRTPSPALAAAPSASSPAPAASPAGPPAASPTATPVPRPVPPPVFKPGFGVASAVLAQPAVSSRRALIQDPDGFSNLRSGPGTQNPVTARLPQGQSLEKLREQGGWWLVRTPEGQTGWVHGSRLRSEQ